jgi:hypothetical protein
VAVLFKAGLHVPVIPLMEVVGSGDKDCPALIGGIGLNVGVIAFGTGFIVLCIGAEIHPEVKSLTETL